MVAQQGDAFADGRFAGTAFANQAQCFTRLQVQRHIVDRVEHLLFEEPGPDRVILFSDSIRSNDIAGNFLDVVTGRKVTRRDRKEGGVCWNNLRCPAAPRMEWTPGRRIDQIGHIAGNGRDVGIDRQLGREASNPTV